MKAHYRINRKQLVFVWMSIIPAFLVFTLFFFYPMVNTFVGSFFDWNALTGKMKFNGIANYQRALADSLLWKSLVNTFYLTFFAVLIKTVLALLVAVMINSVSKGQKAYRMIFFLPTICTMIATAFVFRFLFQAEAGTINGYLSAIGIQGPGWLGDPLWAMPTVIIYTCWKDFGYVFLIFLAGIQGIPTDVVEAATVDGAMGWSKLRYIVMPLLKPITIYNVVTQVIGSFQIFTSIIALTNNPVTNTAGGPMYTTTTLGLHIYQTAFTNYKFGYASVLAVILFAIIMLMTFLQLRFSKQNWGY